MYRRTRIGLGDQAVWGWGEVGPNYATFCLIVVSQYWKSHLVVFFGFRATRLQPGEKSKHHTYVVNVTMNNSADIQKWSDRISA